MRPLYLLLFPVLILFCLQSCNTLYNTQIIDIEIVEPGKVKIPNDYRTVAIRYNNTNVAPNPYFSKAYYNYDDIIEDINYDSIASELYFNYFVDELRKQHFFDTVIELHPKDYSQINIIDTNTYKFDTDFDSIVETPNFTQKLNVYLFSNTLSEYPNYPKESATKQYLHPELALYDEEDLKKIADSTQADLLISLDYFSSLDGILHNNKAEIAKEVVFTHGYWNCYDLKEQEYRFFFHKGDTISWKAYSRYKPAVKRMLPSRKDAILNAADIAGTNFAQFVSPHWIQVQRMYYDSGHLELKTTNKLVKEGKWLEAAEIWKANINNPNKAISAKCKYNMGLACEMKGNLDAALEWVVESYHVFGQKNEQHEYNCTNYIQILAQRKHDIKIIEKQVGLVD